MVKRSYRITPEQDLKITELSSDMGMDKEEVVQLALEQGLEAIGALWIAIGKPRGVVAYAQALMEFERKRIKKLR